MSIAIKIETEIFNKISEIAKDENTTENKIINQILKKEIKNRTEPKIPEHLIMNKDTYKPDSEISDELIGVIETDEPFDTLKAIREIRGIE